MNVTLPSTGRPPGEGERAARRGFVHQDRAAASIVYQAIADRSLLWVGFADRDAGKFDDLVLGVPDAVIGHQFKRSLQPSGVGLTALLLGKEQEIAALAASYRALRNEFPNTAVILRYLSNDYPSQHDTLVKGVAKTTTAAFLSEWSENRQRSLADWRLGHWAPLIDALIKASRLGEDEFAHFWRDFDLVLGSAAIGTFENSGDLERVAQIEDLARGFSALVADNPQRDRWSRAAFLEAVGWRDRFALRFLHSFPVGSYVQRNAVTETRLAAALEMHCQGYLSLVGPPGSGKSTLLQRELRERPKLHIIRYLAFVPGTAQGQGRGEADSFYDDLNAQLAATGLASLRVKDDSTLARQQGFEHLLAQAGECYQNDGTRYVIVVDGLDHIPREERPARSLLSALPLPQSIPEGVAFILGTQRLDLEAMPAAVSQQADQSTRRIEIAPLPETAVATMADALGLSADISRSDVYALSEGHPLVTRYLIERLKSADEQLRALILAGNHGFGGDLEAVYEAAWRGVQLSSERRLVHELLALIAHAQGPIAADLLAEATSVDAVEALFREAGHLLAISPLGWSVFHNSFRLFIQAKPILRYGIPDPALAPAALYQRLADLTHGAAPTSPQRWLTVRYLLLGGAVDEALNMASRAYYVGQYCEGRSRHDVHGDIADTIRALKAKRDPVKLFDLMLADDEIGRRADIMESATSLIDAYLSIGDIGAAQAALDTPHEDGKQWMIIDALLEVGDSEAARRIFERQSPGGYGGHNAPPFGRSAAREALPWAERAVLFYDDEKIEDAISPAKTVESEQDEDSADLNAALKFQVARAFVRAEPEADVDTIMGRWSVAPEVFPILAIEAAETALDAGGIDRAKSLLGRAADLDAVWQIQAFWRRKAGRIAIRVGDRELAARFIESTDLRGLGDVEEIYRTDQTIAACRSLVQGVAAREALGISLPNLKVPKERLLKGAQHHLIALAVALGATRAGRAYSIGESERVIASALIFLASARASGRDEWSSGHVMAPIAEIAVEVAFLLSKAARCAPNMIAVFSDRLIADNSLFAYWPALRRKIAVETFRLDGDRAEALVRLEAGIAAIDASDPREEVEERTAYAVALGKIGEAERARVILNDLRTSSYGAYLPAKKDAQYELWIDLLSRANAADPEGRTSRGAVMLRLLDGLAQTEGSDSAWRIARAALFEATIAEPQAAWTAALWAADRGTISWDGIVDAVLRGMLRRSPELWEMIWLAWSRLCLPWYSEPHASSTATGQFLKDMAAEIDPPDLVKFERLAADGIGALSMPDMKLPLLTVLEEALRGSGAGDVAHQEAERWIENRSRREERSPEMRNYSDIVDFEGIAAAVISERAYYEAQKDLSRGSSREGPTYALRMAAVRIIEGSPWSAVQSFIAEQPELAKATEIQLALARVAIAAGEPDAARAIVAPFLKPEATGWSWPSGGERKRYHLVRHMLGEADAVDAAHADFVDDMAASSYSVSSSLWSLAELFPLMFETVPWSELWCGLEAQIKGSRDYRIGEPQKAFQGIEDDLDLIAALFEKASCLGVSLIHSEATLGAVNLLEFGHHPLLIRIIERLLKIDGEPGIYGMELLCRCADSTAVAAHFQSRLEALAGHADVGVAAAALYLAMRWKVSFARPQRPLPHFYEIHLPDDEQVSGVAAVDESTRGMVIEDPMGWTDPWMESVKKIARYGDVSIGQIRWRVRQLIQSWGGLEAFGHAASKRLEAELGRLRLKLPYRRPQSEAVLRALRHVTGELWHAGCLSFDELRALLHDLRVDPDKARLPLPEQRPSGINLPKVSRMMWGKDRISWLDQVGDEAFDDLPKHDMVFAEWRRSNVREIRVTHVAEYWAGQDAAREGECVDLEEWLDRLPRVVRLGAPIPLYENAGIDGSHTAIFDPYELQGSLEFLLIFCPLTAADLGWVADQRAPHRYVDSAGVEMVWTEWWRDGLDQTVDEDERAAEGQRIIFSSNGFAVFEAKIGPLQKKAAAWRHIKAASGDGDSGSRFATTLAV